MSKRFVGQVRKAAGPIPAMPTRSPMPIWTVYIICSKKRNKYYTGVTNDLRGRLYEHNHGLSPYTKGGEPWALVHFEEFDNIKDAYRREQFLKRKKSKKILEKVISSPDVRLLAESGSRLYVGTQW